MVSQSFNGNDSQSFYGTHLVVLNNQKMENHMFFKRVVSQSKNGKLYSGKNNWKRTQWFLNHKMVNHIFFKRMVSQSKNGLH